jgi:hypothetical protein
VKYRASEGRSTEKLLGSRGGGRGFWRSSANILEFYLDATRHDAPQQS